ncbi:hypothetical protein [Sphingopyxis sp. H115]|uniref:hypothetical protein n=1 Tax=Sphingopyxis sp. H115 TaxID=1759073 RepID=UPI000A9A797A|nr:hypothetical protein [Sphingopyxis sp. H115]
MTRSFLQYPTGMVGLALVLLRLSAAATLAGGALLAAPGDGQIAAFLLAGTLALGTFTRLAAAIGAIGMVAMGVELEGVLGVSATLHATAMVALSMLGAGGYSIDALLFGRRVIRLDRQAGMSGLHASLTEADEEQPE